MTTVTDLIADAFAARADVETVDSGVLRRRREEVEARSQQAGAGVFELGIAEAGPGTDAGPGALEGSESQFSRRRWLAVAAAAVAAAAVLLASLAGIDRFTHRGAISPASSPQDLFEVTSRPQVPSDRAKDNDLGSSVVASSIRVVATTRTATYWVGVTTDHQVCFSAESESGGSNDCTLSGFWHRRFNAGEALDVEVGDGTTAWLTPYGYDTDALRRKGFTNIAPNLWVKGGPVAGSRPANARPSI